MAIYKAWLGAIGDRITGRVPTTATRRTSTRVCNLCEAMCGLAIDHDAHQVHAIRGNAQDLFSAGAFCPKSQGLWDLYQDPDRLRRPLKRVGDSFVETSWEQAFTEIDGKLRTLQKAHGSSTIATYLGNPNSHHAGNLLTLPIFLKGLRTRNKYSATSVDQLPHMLAAFLMFGHQLLLPIADVNRADYMLILGANPAVSNGSLLSGAGLSTRLKAIGKRGGKVVVIDPRYTETASVASEHHHIRPGTDAFLLAAIVQKLLAAPRLRHLAGVVQGLPELQTLFAELRLASLESLTGVSDAVATQIAADFLHYDKGVCYGRVGVSTQRFGAVCQWLINLINILSGNLDREGGALFTKPAVDIVALMGKAGNKGSFARRRSRVRGLPEFGGELPSATLADEILTPGDGQVRGLFTIAGNPVLSLPNGRKLESALAQLELYVAIDFYRNETTRFAHYILPPVSPLEHDHFDLIFQAFALRDTVRYSPKLLHPPVDSYEDWEILLELWSRMVPRKNRAVRLQRRVLTKTARSLGLAFFLDKLLRLGPYRQDGMSLPKLLAHPHGIDLGALKPCLPERLFTKDKKIHLCPAEMLPGWRDFCRAAAAEGQGDGPGDATPPKSLVLIGRRNLKSNNSWMHNCPSLNKGRSQCYALMHPRDAHARGISDGDQVAISTKIASIALPVVLTERIMPGVVSIPHGWGHHRAGTRLDVASSNPGVSLNDVLDDSMVDEFCGNASLVGQKADVRLAHGPACPAP